MEMLFKHPDQFAMLIITIALLISAGFFLARFGLQRFIAYSGDYAISIPATLGGVALFIVGITLLIANASILLAPLVILGLIFLLNR
jgi:hypothetical protein